MKRIAVPTSVVVLLGIPGLVAAQEASLQLSREVALWTDVVEARIEGTGCTGELLEGSPTLSYDPALPGWAVDIDLADCRAGVEIAFSTTVPIGPLYPQRYLVRLQDAIRFSGAVPGPEPKITPPPSPFDSAELIVHPEASLGVEVEGTPVAGAPLALTLVAPTFSSCFRLEEPEIDGTVIRAAFADECPILPPVFPAVTRETFQVGPLAAGRYEVRFFDVTYDGQPFPTDPLRRLAVTVFDPQSCVPSPTVLCLRDGRFQVTVEWEDFQGETGRGRAVPQADRDGTGLFWFFSRDNLELTLKVLEGCAVNGHWWVFVSSGSTVEYTITVLDTATARTWSYTNPRGVAAPLVPDTAAFSCAAG